MKSESNNKIEIERGDFNRLLENQQQLLSALLERSARYGYLDTPLNLQIQIVEYEKRLAEIYKGMDKYEKEISLLSGSQDKFQFIRIIRKIIEAQNAKYKAIYPISTILISVSTIIIALTDFFSSEISEFVSSSLHINFSSNILAGIAFGLLTISAITIWYFEYKESQEEKFIQKIHNFQKVVTDRNTKTSNNVEGKA